MMNSRPRNPAAGIIIRTHNQGDRVHSAIAGVLKRSFADFELFVVDYRTDGRHMKLLPVVGVGPNLMNSAPVISPSGFFLVSDITAAIYRLDETLGFEVVDNVGREFA